MERSLYYLNFCRKSETRQITHQHLSKSGIKLHFDLSRQISSGQDCRIGGIQFNRKEGSLPKVFLSGRQLIDINNYASGVYFVNVKLDGMTLTERLVKSF
ncbi:MAG: T9SS type A sorting domain-containing protein [Bacteroidetes bacterium]|nr:T9SS type A sorting domain-containing protein [Bacteroidota bacterium]